MRATAARPSRAGSTEVGPEPRIGARSGRRAAFWTIGMAIALAVSLVVAIGFGPVFVDPATIVAVLGYQLGFDVAPRWTPAHENIVWMLRLPRVLLGALVGAALAVAGAGIQALVRNILADPYLLGISSGATTGAAASILFGVGSGLGVGGLTGSAFLGALIAIALVFGLARTGGALISSRLVFAGIAVGFALTALTNFLVFLSNSRDGIRAVMFWMLGSLSQASWRSLPILAVVLVLSLLLMMLWARRFDAMAIGDDTARALGTHPTRFRAVSVLVIALLVAAAVSVSGTIGFVGLVVPHLARRLVGASHRRVLPASALLGALLIIWADVIARTAFAPQDLPLGVLTALLGTPLLIALVRKMVAAG